MNNEHMTAEEAGKYLSPVGKPIPVATLQWWRSHGKGPKYFKVGKRIIYARADLDAFMASCVVEPEAA